MIFMKKRLRPLYIRKYGSILAASCVELAAFILAVVFKSIIIGRIIGLNGLAAVAIVLPFSDMGNFFSLLMEMGFEMQYSEAVSRFDQKQAERIFGMGLMVSAIVGTLLAVFYGTCISAAVHYAHISPEVSKLVMIILPFMCVESIFFDMVIYLGEIATLDGGEWTANLAMVVQTIGNIVLSVFLGLRYGMAGIAAASLISLLLNFLIVMTHFLKKTTTIRPRAWFSWEALRRTAAFGFVDASASLYMAGLALLVESFVVIRFGEMWLPVLTIVFDLYTFSVVLDNSGEAVLALVNMFKAEKNVPVLRDLMKHAVRIAILSGLLYTLGIFALAPVMPAVYNLGGSPVLAAQCVLGLRIMSMIGIPAAILFLFTTYYLVIGKRLLAVLGVMMNFVSVVLLAIPLGMMTGLEGVWVGFGLSSWMTLLVFALVLRKRYGAERFPLLLHEGKDRIINRHFLLVPETIAEEKDRAGAFLQDLGATRSGIVQTMLAMEETCMLIRNRNPGDREIQAHVSVRVDDRIHLVIWDNGLVFNVTDEEMPVSDLNAYVAARLSVKLRDKKNIGTVGFNRNTFDLSF